jgi:hypothetical protein
VDFLDELRNLQRPQDFVAYELVDYLVLTLSVSDFLEMNQELKEFVLEREGIKNYFILHKMP